MVNEILDAAGLLYPVTRFPKLPDGTCVIPMDDIEAQGADDIILFYIHNVTLEMYQSKPDPAAEAALEAELNARGLKWEKQARYWLQSEQRYQVVYEFSYTSKT